MRRARGDDDFAPERGPIVWLQAERFRTIYGTRRDRLAELGLDVAGLDAALSAVATEPEKVLGALRLPG